MNSKIIQFVPPIPPEERCTVCGDLRVKAEFLCDMPIEETWNTIDFKKRIVTCDKRLCRKCTTHINGFDFCPDCINELLNTKQGV